MKNFLSDLWQDLREKRLWPVAVVLLAALVAVPVVLSESSEEPPAAPAAAADDDRDVPEPRELKQLASVKLEEGTIGKGSSLDTFDPSNPFRPPRSVMKEPEQAQEASDAGPGSGDAGSDSSGGDAVIDGGSGGGDGGSVDTGGGDTGGGDTGGTGGGETTTTQFKYVIDVTFWANGRKRTINTMERLHMLPNQNSPLLLFLGVTSDGGNAVFLVDSTLDAAGEGSCKPTDDECAFLHLGPGSEHSFTTEDGDSYDLRVDEIRRVKIEDKAKAAASKKRGTTAGAAVGRNAPGRRFALPLLADLVSVSSNRGGNSNSNRASR